MEWGSDGLAQFPPPPPGGNFMCPRWQVSGDFVEFHIHMAGLAEAHPDVLAVRAQCCTAEMGRKMSCKMLFVRTGCCAHSVVCTETRSRVYKTLPTRTSTSWRCGPHVYRGRALCNCSVQISYARDIIRILAGLHYPAHPDILAARAAAMPGQRRRARECSMHYTHTRNMIHTLACIQDPAHPDIPAVQKSACQGT